MNGFNNKGEVEELSHYERNSTSGELDIPEWVNIESTEGYR